jgi:hypothetical protein
MRAAQKFTHSNAHFVTHHRGCEQLLATGAQGLRDCDRRRKHDGGGMKHRTVVHIVLLSHMGSRCIGHGSQIGRRGLAIDDHFTGPL